MTKILFCEDCNYVWGDRDVVGNRKICGKCDGRIIIIKHDDKRLESIPDELKITFKGFVADTITDKDFWREVFKLKSIVFVFFILPLIILMLLIIIPFGILYDTIVHPIRNYMERRTQNDKQSKNK